MDSLINLSNLNRIATVSEIFKDNATQCYLDIFWIWITPAGGIAKPTAIYNKRAEIGNIFFYEPLDMITIIRKTNIDKKFIFCV